MLNEIGKIACQMMHCMANCILERRGSKIVKK